MHFATAHPAGMLRGRSEHFSALAGALTGSGKSNIGCREEVGWKKAGESDNGWGWWIRPGRGEGSAVLVHIISYPPHEPDPLTWINMGL